MDGFDRIYDLHRILKGRKTAISTKEIMDKMECSRATFNRIKRHMTDFLGAPIEYDRDQGGHYYAIAEEGAFELPGIWFNEKELQALLLIQQLLADIGVGVFEDELSPISERIEALLRKNGLDSDMTSRRIRHLGVAMRNVQPEAFLYLVEASLKSQAIELSYTTRESGQVSRRVVSPQRVINYRNNWYLDVWCHSREYFRTFSMECISAVKKSHEPFKSISSDELDQYFQASYGIYAGGDIAIATVIFSDSVARRVSQESWHPEQQGVWLDDGRYQLQVPVNMKQPDEFLQDILSFSHHASIVGPTALKARLREMLKQTLQNYLD